MVAGSYREWSLFSDGKSGEAKAAPFPSGTIPVSLMGWIQSKLGSAAMGRGSDTFSSEKVRSTILDVTRR